VVSCADSSQSLHVEEVDRLRERWGDRSARERERRGTRERVGGICDKVKNNNRIASQPRHDSPSSPSPPTETEASTPRPRTSSSALCGSCRIIYAKYWHSVKPTTLHSLHCTHYTALTAHIIISTVIAFTSPHLPPCPSPCSLSPSLSPSLSSVSTSQSLPTLLILNKL
jgi:hypothetical protein